MPFGVEFHRTDPVLMPFSRHDELSLVHRPYFPKHIVAACPYDRFFGVKDDCGYSHRMFFFAFSEYCLFVIELISNLGQLVFPKRCKFVLPPLYPSGGLHSRQGIFFIAGFLFQFIPLNFDQSLLFHSKMIFFVQFLIFLGILLLESIQPLDVLVQFLLLGLDPLVVHAVEITLFKQSVVGRLCAFGHYDRFGKLRSQLVALVFQDLVFELGVRDLLSPLCPVVPLSLSYDYLYLKRVECFGHAIPGEEVPDEIVDNFQPSDMSRLIIPLSLNLSRRHNGLPEGTSHQSIKFPDIFKTILQIIQLPKFLQQFLSIRIATDFYLFDHIDVSLLLFGHQLYNLFTTIVSKLKGRFASERGGEKGFIVGVQLFISLTHADNVLQLNGWNGLKILKQSKRRFMGACLKMFSSQEEPPQKPVKMEKEPESDRTSLKQTQQQQPKEQSIYGRGSNIEMESTSSVRETKIFFKSKSTALFSTDGERRHSSVLQFTLDHQSMIVKPQTTNQKEGAPEEYYTLVDKIAFVRKTKDCLRVTTPEGQSQLNCPPQYLFSTLTVSEGKPADCLQEVGPNRFIQVDNSPIRLRLKLRCGGKQCKKLMKATFCKGVVSINSIICPNCEKKDQLWSIEDIECNFPVWGGGVKIDNHERVEPAPDVLRAMGCVICLKFTNCEEMKCGCLICKACLTAQEHLSLQQDCWMCEGNSYIL